MNETCSAPSNHPQNHPQKPPPENCMESGYLPVVGARCATRGMRNLRRMARPGSAARRTLAAWTMGFAFVMTGLSGELTDEELTKIRDSFAERRDAGLAALRGRPLEISPVREPLSQGRPRYARHFSYSIVDFALAALWNDEQVETANEALEKWAGLYIDDRDLRNDRDSFYWPADVLCRIVEFFGPAGSIAPGRLYPETYDKLLEAMWLYSKEHSFIGAAIPLTHPRPAASQPISAEWEESRTWHVAESENHHLMKLSTLWHFSRFLKEAPQYREKTYNDGHTAGEHHAAWTSYACEYLRQRAKKGLFIEMANGSYGSHSIKGIYNFHDFADDARLRELAGMFLDLYYASWAQEQLDGVRGGGQSRVGNFRNGQTPIRRLMWFYLGAGDEMKIAGVAGTVATSNYRLPMVVMDLALDVDGRGEYEVRERRPGLAVTGYFTNPDYRLRTDFGGILRYSYCTPDFIMGMPLIEARPYEEWTLISSQNRRQGVIFRGNIHARIAPICSTDRPATFNEQWGVQKHGTMITQRLSGAYSRGAGPLRVWISTQGLENVVERGGWVFAEAEGAYAAVRPARNGYDWETEGSQPAGRWLAPEDPDSPVIIEAAQKADFEGYEAFQDAILAQPMEWDREVLSYTGLRGDRFTFFADFSGPPQINGEPIDLAPPNVFNSPFVKSEWNSGIVTIQKGNRGRQLNFND